MDPNETRAAFAEMKATIVRMMLVELWLDFRCRAEVSVRQMEEDSGQDLASVRAQLDQIFGTMPMPALPALPGVPEPDAQPRPNESRFTPPKKGRKKPFGRQDTSSDEVPID